MCSDPHGGRAGSSAGCGGEPVIARPGAVVVSRQITCPARPVRRGARSVRGGKQAYALQCGALVPAGAGTAPARQARPVADRLPALPGTCSRSHRRAVAGQPAPQARARGRDLVRRLEASLAGERDLDVRSRIDVRYAAGKVYSDLGEHNAAFAHYAHAGSLRSRIWPWHVDGMGRVLTAVRERVAATDLRTARAGGFCSDRPVFVFGMPRSGTRAMSETVGVDGPDGIERARVRSLQISAKGTVRGAG